MRIRAFALALSTLATLTLVACGTTVVGAASPGVATSPAGGQTSTSTTDEGVPNDGAQSTEISTPAVTTPEDTPLDPVDPTDLTLPSDFPTDLEGLPTDLEGLPTDLEGLPTDLELPSGMPSDACITVATAVAGVTGMSGLPAGDFGAAIAAAPEIADELQVLADAVAKAEPNGQADLMTMMQDPTVLKAFEAVGKWLQTDCYGG